MIKQLTDHTWSVRRPVTCTWNLSHTIICRQVRRSTVLHPPPFSTGWGPSSPIGLGKFPIGLLRSSVIIDQVVLNSLSLPTSGNLKPISWPLLLLRFAWSRNLSNGCSPSCSCVYGPTPMFHLWSIRRVPCSGKYFWPHVPVPVWTYSSFWLNHD